MTETINPNTTQPGGESVKIHPLVILNISDHFTRVRAQNSCQISLISSSSKQNKAASGSIGGTARAGNAVQVHGALYGKQEGREIEVITSFELALVDGAETPQIDMSYYQSKAEKFREVFDLEFLGWYTTGGQPDKSDSSIHRQFMIINENPLLLKLSPLHSSSSELPLSLWEGCVGSDGEQITFLPLTYTLSTDEAERIGVDHVARVSTVHHSRKTTLGSTGGSGIGGGGSVGTSNDFLPGGGTITVSEPQSTITDQYMSHHSAVKMLHSRVRLILDYVQAIQSGQLGPVNQEILRRINSLCHTLPLVPPVDAMSSAASSSIPSSHSISELFEEEFHQQYNEVALLSFLGTLMKGCNSINQYAQKFSKVHDQPLGSQQGFGRGKPRGGIFM